MKGHARRCLIADDHPAMAAAVGSLLALHGFDVVGPASDGVKAVALAVESRPDAAIIDYRMPRLGGAELVARLHEAVPETPVLVYTAEAGDALVREALGAGAAGIVLKDAPVTDVLRALDVVASGRTYIDPALARDAMVSPSGSRSALTAREVDILRLLAEGLSHQEIGRRLTISGETVRTHVRKATTRLGAATRTQAVATALRNGLIS